MVTEFENEFVDHKKSKDADRQETQSHGLDPLALRSHLGENKGMNVPEVFASNESFSFVWANKEQSKGDKRTKDPKLQKIFDNIADDDFDKREAGSKSLDAFLKHAFKSGRSSEALQDVFRAMTADTDLEIRRRVYKAVTQQWNDSSLDDRAKLIGHGEKAVREWASKNMRQILRPFDSEQRMMLAGLGAAAEKSQNEHLTKFVREIGREYHPWLYLNMFEDEGKRITDEREQFEKKLCTFLHRNSADLSQMEPEKRAKAVKQLLQDSEDFVTKGDKTSEKIGALARVLLGDDKLKSVMTKQQAREFTRAASVIGTTSEKDRSTASSMLILIAEDLKNNGKDQGSVDKLQEAAIHYYKELLADPNSKMGVHSRDWYVKHLRALNPKNFDRLVPDRLGSER